MTTPPLRDSRLHEIDWLGPQGLARLRAQRVAILGVGNIGGEAARHLAMLGIPLLLVDRGIVEPANLGTQGFSDEDLGLPKVEARRRALLRMNPDCPIDVLALDIETMGFAALRLASLWLCCLDSLRLRVRVNDMALRLGIPWIDADIDGAGRPIARVARYDLRSDSACFLCGYGPEGLRDVLQQGVATPCPTAIDHAPDAPPTHAVSAMGSLAASIQVLWAMNSGLGLPHRSGHTEVLLNLDDLHCRPLSRPRDPHCVAAHDPWLLTAGLHQSQTLDEAFLFAERFLGDQVVITLVHRSLVTELGCGRCGTRSRPDRVLDALTREQLCGGCGASHRGTATGWLDRMSRVEAAEFLDRPLRQLGIPTDDVLIARSGDRVRYLLVAGAPETALTIPLSHQDMEREGPHGSRV